MKNSKNPYQERKERTKDRKRYADIDLDESPELLKVAAILGEKGFQKIDCLHIACAVLSECQYVLTTDDGILKRGKTVDSIKIDDPIGFIMGVWS